MTISLTDLSDTELDQLRQDVGAEMERRRVIAQAPIRADEIAQEYAKAVGREMGEEWAQPASAVDAYPVGWVVTHEGKQWENLTPANVWQPGVSGWRETLSEDEDGNPTVPEYVQPTGAHDAYKKGDQVTFDGAVYESIIDGNVWTPRDYPQGWKVVNE